MVTDPYTPEAAGLNPVEEPADVGIMSSATNWRPTFPYVL
jgi:hypothetical protein